MINQAITCKEEKTGSLCLFVMSHHFLSSHPAVAGVSPVPSNITVPVAPAAAVSQATDLAALFECPVCFDYVLPPIHQCDSGHLICSNCRPKLQHCPACRGQLGSVRNLAMEKVADTVMFPCKYVNSGCTLRLLHKDKRTHEETCEYRPYSCPCPGTTCRWLGNLEEVLDHLLSAHKTITTLNGEDIVFLATDINLPGAVDWVMMQCCFDHHFMLVLEKQERHENHQQFFAVVQIIGTEKQAEQFRYKLELVDSRHSRKLTWEAKPRSIHDGIANVITGNDCLIFEPAMAQHFGENGNLAINVTIGRVCY